MITMQPKDYDERHLSLPCYVSPKFDGVRMYDAGKAFCFRSDNEVPEVWDLHQACGAMPHRPDGEGLVPGLPFAESAGIMRSHNYDRRTNIYLFDLWDHRGPFEDRYQDLKRFAPKHPRIHVITHYYVKRIDDVMLLHSKFLAAGLEGTVIKTPHHYYEPGETWEWMRIVPLKSADILVIGMIEGKGKHKGRMGSLKCLINRTTPVKVGTGFDDDTRQAWWDDPTLIVGKTIRVTFKEYTHKGSLRQPRFDRIRIDK